MARDRHAPLWMVSLYLKLSPLWPIVGRQFLVVGMRPSAD
jgi:hypothetical protein